MVDGSLLLLYRVLLIHLLVVVAHSHSQRTG